MLDTIAINILRKTVSIIILYHVSNEVNNKDYNVLKNGDLRLGGGNNGVLRMSTVTCSFCYKCDAWRQKITKEKYHKIIACN